MIRFSPHPPGKSYGVSFVDDTDFSTVENTKPVYDLLAEHGFWGTKTVWPLRAKRNSAFRRDLEVEVPTPDTGGTLEDSDYRDFVKALQCKGFEIALHGVAAGNSTRAEILKGLRYFADVLGQTPAMNIFHQANIENLYCGLHKLDSPWFRLLERVTDRSDYEGHRPGFPSFWGDIVQKTFRYVRLPFHTIDEINTLGVNPSMPFHDSRRPFVPLWFAASDGADVVRFNRLFAAANVDRLARQRGVCIVYTHFANQFARRDRSGYALDNEFVETIRRLTTDSRAWFVTTTALLDRLRAIKSLSLQHDEFRVEVSNGGDSRIDQLVLLTPSGMRLESQNEPIEQGPGYAVIPSLPASSTIILKSNRRGRHFRKPADTNVGRAERRRIERMNYFGLVRGALRDRLFYARRGNR